MPFPKGLASYGRQMSHTFRTNQTMGYKSIFLILLLFNGIWLSAQSAQIRQLEIEVHQSKGVDRVQKLIRLSEMFLKEGYVREAIDMAQNAQREAAQISRMDLKAIALNKEAKAVFLEGGTGRKRAEKLVRESLKTLPVGVEDALRLENLELLRKHAQATGNTKEAADLSAEIARLKGENVENQQDAPKSGGLFGNRRRQLNELRQREADISEQLDSLKTVAGQSTRQQEMLNQQLARKEREIANMSEAQMRQELILSQQEKILDSLSFIGLIDSIRLEEQQSRLREQEMELREQAATLELQKSQRNLLLVLAGVVLIIAFGIWSRYASIKRYNSILEEKNKIIEAEKERSENLLLNILPKAIADELKARGTAAARHYEQVTVLFTDFKNFSKIAEQLTPQQLVTDLDFCFKKFDGIVAKYGLEKIKTIGDSYMCAGGLPGENAAHPYSVVMAALEMQRFLAAWKGEKIMRKEPFFEARLGIHTGPIVAGVVGEKKYAYDIWGETVNIASRIETGGEPGRVNISDATYKLIRDKFQCDYRGKIPAKNIGEIDMYFVNDDLPAEKISA